MPLTANGVLFRTRYQLWTFIYLGSLPERKILDHLIWHAMPRLLFGDSEKINGCIRFSISVGARIKSVLIYFPRSVGSAPTFSHSTSSPLQEESSVRMVKYVQPRGLELFER